jgi:hypothetical protein
VALSLRQAVVTGTATGVAYGSAVAKGDLLVATFSASSSSNITISGITDSLGNSWSSAISISPSGQGGGAIWWAVANGAGTPTLTITSSGGTWEVFLYNVEGFSGTPLLDIHQTATGTTGDPTLGPYTTIYAVEGDVRVDLVFGHRDRRRQRLDGHRHDGGQRRRVRVHDLGRQLHGVRDAYRHRVERHRRDVRVAGQRANVAPCRSHLLLDGLLRR